MLLQDLLVLLGLVLLEVREELAALCDFTEQTAAGGVVLAVIFQVVCKETDDFGEQRDLDLRRAGVLGMLAVLGDECFLGRALENHRETRENELAPGRSREIPQGSADAGVFYE